MPRPSRSGSGSSAGSRRSRLPTRTVGCSGARSRRGCSRRPWPRSTRCARYRIDPVRRPVTDADLLRAVRVPGDPGEDRAPVCVPRHHRGGGARPRPVARPKPIGCGLLPIAVGYLIAHYLTYLLISGQLIVVAVSDPFQRGWDIFGTLFFEPSADLIPPGLVWTLQLAAVVGGHMVGAWAGHAAAVAMTPPGTPIRTVRLRLPLAVVMVALTTLTLWSLGGTSWSRRTREPDGRGGRRGHNRDPRGGRDPLVESEPRTGAWRCAGRAPPRPRPRSRSRSGEDPLRGGGQPDLGGVADCPEREVGVLTTRPDVALGDEVEDRDLVSCRRLAELGDGSGIEPGSPQRAGSGVAARA